MVRVAAVGGLLASGLVGCSDGGTGPNNPPIKIATITIDGGPRSIERGTTVALTATAKDSAGKVIPTPFAWRSTVDTVVSVDRDGKITGLVVGNSFISASALGVSSANTEIVVVWLGPANVAPVQFNPPNAVSPSADLKDSLRVLVTNTTGQALIGVKVRFAVTAGGGTVSPGAPVLAKTNQQGVAAAKWTMGPTAGVNTATATVVFDTDTTLANTNVKANPATFSVKSYAALQVLQGDNQTGSVLAALPVTPQVKLVDSAGKPRAGIPITFAPTGNGRVATTVVSTAADGSASPGTWTLGDASGDEQLIITVEAAKVVLHATATGTTVRLSAAKVATTQAASCALSVDQFASCFGQSPQIGTGDTANKSTPTLTKGSVQFTSLVGNGGHFCGTGTDLSLYCWGLNALVDTTGATNSTLSPTRLPSNIAWVQVAPGGQHNCALANDRTAYCWGDNANGQLGNNTTTRRFTPGAVAGGFKFTVAVSGTSHSCGITADSVAFCWGANASGQLGDGTTANRLTPTALFGSIKWKAIGAGAAWTCGLNNAGAAYCWGANTASLVPVTYTGSPIFSSLSVGTAHACGLTGDGTAYCWGDNSSGQLGDSTTTPRNTPTVVVTQLRFSSISAGFQHTCGVTTDGFVACWGRNVAGELGTSTQLVQTTPRYIILEIKP
jgi:alpha-tubulin suppressor-like RCC1 family protein